MRLSRENTGYLSFMIFLAVGTQFGFDRLVKAVDEAIEQQFIQEKVYAQIGPGRYLPRQMEYAASLEKEDFNRVLNSCEAIISHAGMGNISLALEMKKPLLVMPRLKRFGEVVNDHQVATAQRFEQLGHILAAYDEKELVEKIKLLRTFVPKLRNPNRQGVAERILRFLQEISG